MKSRERALLYQTLGQMLNAGVPNGVLFQTIATHSRSAEAKEVVRHLERTTSSGALFGEAFATAPGNAIPKHHALRIRGAEKGGGLSDELRELALDEESQISIQQDLMSRLAYPTFLFHFTVAVTGFTQYVASGSLAPLVPYLLLMVVIDAGLFAVGSALFRDEPLAPGTGWIRSLPLARTVLRDHDYSLFLRTLRTLYDAGIPIREAAADAVSVVLNPTRSNRLSTAISLLDDGESFASAVAKFPSLRPEIRAILMTSEPAGELGSGLERAATLSREQARLGSIRLVKTIGIVVYGLAIVLAVHRILSFYVSYFSAFK